MLNMMRLNKKSKKCTLIGPEEVIDFFSIIPSNRGEKKYKFKGISLLGNKAEASSENFCLIKNI